MKIKEIAFVAYSVTDVKRAREFYEGVLGLTPSVEHVKDNKNAFIEYWIGEKGEHCLVIGAGASQFKPGKAGATVALEVDDIDEAVARLKKAHIKLLMDRYDGPVCSMVLAEDPDGNQIMLHRRVEKR